MVTREEQARLDELCMMHGITGETDEERYGRLALTLVDVVKWAKKRGPRPKWNDERKLLFLQLVDRQKALLRLRPDNTDEIVEKDDDGERRTWEHLGPDEREGWYLDADYEALDKSAIAKVKDLYPELFEGISDKRLSNVLSEARALLKG